MGHGQTVTVTHGRKTKDLTSLAESSSFARALQAPPANHAAQQLCRRDDGF